MPGTRLFGRMGSVVRSCLREIWTTQILADDEWKLIRQFFANKCCYCGCEDSGNFRTGLVPDHVEPRCRGGDLVLGNAFPACHDCNDRRGSKNWESFLKSLNLSPAEFSDRWNRMQMYLEEFPYKLATPETRLPSHILKEYLEIDREFSALIEKTRNLKRITDQIRYAKDISSKHDHSL
jgi:hypothetical protein